MAASSSTTAGYSGTPLPKKLSIKDNHVVALLGAPDEMRDWLGELPEGATLRTDLRAKPNVVVAFFDTRSAFTRRLDALSRAIFPDGGLWICWPKRASGLPTDMTGDVIREIILGAGLVDVKVCAVSEVWSALRIVHRTENR